MNKIIEYTKKNQKKMGYVLGFLAILIYAIINVIAQSKPKANEMNEYIYALIFVCVKEFFAVTCWLLFNKNPINNIKKLWHTMRHDPKGLFFASLAGMFGGTIGFTLTTVGSIYLGSGLGSPIYSVETLIVMTVLMLFFKKKTTKQHILGLLVTTIAAVMMPVASIIIGGAGDSKNAWLGAGLLLLGVGCWSVESIIFDLLSVNKKRDVSTLLGIKQIASFVLGMLIVMPIFGASFTTAKGAFDDFGSIFHKHARILLYGFIAGTLLYFGRLLFFKSLQYVGAASANAIYSAMPLIQVPIAAIADLCDDSRYYVGSIHHPTFWPLMLVLLIGIAISAIAQTKNKEARL